MQPPPPGTARRPAEERRKSPRVRTRLPMQVGLPGALGDAAVQDISLSGVRCTTVVSLPVMTQVGLELLVASPAGGERRIACQGVVVRTREARDDAGGEPSEAERYETAIFFTSMTDGDRLFLDDYLRMVAASPEERGDPSI